MPLTPPSRNKLAVYDVTGTLFDAKRDDRPYPLYGAFIEAAIDEGIIPMKALFPRDTEGQIQWENPDQCIPVFRESLRGLGKSAIRLAAAAMYHKLKEESHIPSPMSELLDVVGSMGSTISHAVISQTQVDIVNPYLDIVAEKTGITFSVVRGSTLQSDPSDATYTGQAKRVNKTRALEEIMKAGGHSELWLAAGDDIVDVPLLARAEHSFAVNPTDRLRARPEISSFHIIEKQFDSMPILRHAPTHMPPYLLGGNNYALHRILSP